MLIYSIFAQLILTSPFILLLTTVGYQGHAVILEMSGHFYSSNSKTKRLAPFAPIVNEGLDGEPKYFEETLLPLCASIKNP